MIRYQFWGEHTVT